MKNQPSLKKIEADVKASYPTEKYKALCERAVDVELRIAYLESAEGKANGIELSGEKPYLEELKNVKRELSLVEMNKRFLEEQIYARFKSK